MGVKYVKDFGFDSGFGFSGSAGKTSVRPHMRSPALAGAMVEKTTPGMGGKASETKNLASYNKPHMSGKKGPSVPTYAKGGAVKGKKAMPAFLKDKVMKKADGGEIGIAEDPTYEERMEIMRQRGSDLDRLPDMTREGMGETRGGPGVAISPLNRAAAITAARNMAMRPNADLMRRAGEAVRGRMPVPRRAMPVAPKAPMTGYVRPAPGVMMKKGGMAKGEAKVGKVMGEFKRGELHSGSKKGPVVKNPKQAVAIALSEARHAGAKIPKKAS